MKTRHPTAVRQDIVGTRCVGVASGESSHETQSRIPLSGLSRRAILGRGAIVAAALGFGGQINRADAHEATPDAMASHPIVGTWYVSTPAGPALATFFADGTNIQGLPATQAGPNGVEFVSTQVGRWKPEGERGVHFTGVQLHSDANGTLIGTVTIDAHPVVSEDRQTLCADENRSRGRSSATRRATSSPIWRDRWPARDRRAGWTWEHPASRRARRHPPHRLRNANRPMIAMGWRTSPVQGNYHRSFRHLGGCSTS